MTTTVDFLPFATGSGANVEDQAAFAVDGSTTNGFSSGIASSAKFNKILRQSSFVGAAIANWISQQLNISIADDGDLAGFITKFKNAHGATVVASSLGANGYRVWSNGQIDQWGTAPLGAGGTNTIGGSFTFPIPFTAAVWSLTGNADNTAGGGWSPIVVTFPSTTLTGSGFSADTAKDTQPISSGRNIRWMATGI